VALRYAAKDRSVDVIVCLSPDLDVPGLDPRGDLGQIRGRAVLIAGAEDERAACDTLAGRNDGVTKKLYADPAHGTALLSSSHKAAQDIADSTARGVGSPSTTLVYGSIERSVYHLPDSGWVAQISPSNLRVYSSPQEAESRGLRAARSRGPRDGADSGTRRAKPREP
jgi:hypothetical protein